MDQLVIKHYIISNKLNKPVLQVLISLTSHYKQFVVVFFFTEANNFMTVKGSSSYNAIVILNIVEQLSSKLTVKSCEHRMDTSLVYLLQVCNLLTVN